MGPTATTCCYRWHGTHRYNLLLQVAWDPPLQLFFKKLASLLSEKRSINYSRCLYWLRCRLCYSLLRSSVMCLRGHRSTQQHQTLKWPTLKVTLSLAAVFECWSPSCPALCHLVLGVVARAVHLAREKKKKKHVI